MIFDKLSNIDFYNGLSEDIYQGLLFIKQANPDIAKGVYQLSPRVKAIVSEYETQRESVCGFEAHKRFIDIQCVLKGSEKVCYMPIEKLEETQPYNDENDAAFYSTDEQPQELIIGDGYFAIFFPQDGHMPQLCVDKPQIVKKIVIKIKID
jgi:YhcH/YjgK/YiaL family protein